MQDLVNGLAQGAIYSLAGVGLVLIFSVVRVPNFAHGEPVMIAAMLPLTLMTVFQMPLALALLIGIVAAVAFGYLLSVGIFSRLTGYPEVSLLIVSLALVVIVSSVAVMIWGDNPTPDPRQPDRRSRSGRDPHSRDVAHYPRGRIGGHRGVGLLHPAHVAWPHHAGDGAEPFRGPN